MGFHLVKADEALNELLLAKKVIISARVTSTR
jgi:hypothetical protein